jgi:succinoglycan biosynthesis transport protein ExoP
VNFDGMDSARTARETQEAPPRRRVPGWAADVPGAEGWTLAGVAAVWRRRWPLLAGICAGCVLLAALYCVVKTPQFASTGTVELEQNQGDSFGLQTSVMGAPANATQDALESHVMLETQVDILKSDTLALRVIGQLGLERTPGYFGHKPGGWHLPGWVAFWRHPLEPLSVPLADAPDRRYVALKIFHQHLTVKAVDGTRLIEVSYRDESPERAAAVVNALMQALMSYGFEARSSETAQATHWLGGQLAELKTQTEALQARALQLQRETGMFGDDEQNNIMLARLSALNQTLAADEADRILKQAIYRTAESGDPEMISDLGGNAAQSTGVQNSLALIQTLRAQEAKVQAQIALDNDRYGARFPEMAELNSELASVKGSIAQEVHRLGERAKTDYLIAARTEASAQADFDQQKALVNQLNDKAVAYALAKQEADTSRNLYEGLLAKLKEAGILEGLASTNMHVVNPGRVPPVDHPASPNFKKDEAIALAGGLLLGLLAMAWGELADRRLYGRCETEKLLGEPLLAVIPLASGAGPRWRAALEELRMRWRPKAGRRTGAMPGVVAVQASAGSAPPLPVPAAESAGLSEPFRLLRTAVQTRHSGRRTQVILVTGPAGGEGKSTVAAQLARAFAWQKSRVLLVEADFRSAGQEMPLPDGVRGLSGELQAVSRTDLKESIFRDDALPNLAFLPRGALPESPADLLESVRMKELIRMWRLDYDYIVLDGPAYLPVADGAVLAQQADAALLVLREGHTHRDDAVQSLTQLEQQMAREGAVGVVLNGAEAVKGRAYAMAC